MSKLINDLKTIPDIIGELGLNIAAAQKALNYDYINNLTTIVAIGKDLIGKAPPPQAPAGGAAPVQPAAPPAESDLVLNVIKQLAPVRYVYTETTLDVKLDLAQSTQIGGSAALGGGIGAVMVNAAFSLAFAQEYRGTAECHTVINVDTRSGAVSDAMMSHVQQLDQKQLQLTDAPPVDQKIYDSLKSLRDSLHS